MLALGVDAHRRAHIVVIDEVGRQLGTGRLRPQECHRALAARTDGAHGREWAVEDSRHLTEARRALKRPHFHSVFHSLLADATALAVDLAEAA